MNMHNGLTLAYLGDAIWEIRIREYLMSKGLTKVNDLHKTAIKYTSATGEALAAEALLAGELSEAETEIFKRGRNAESTHKPKSVDLGTYHKATGFEALIGNLYLEKQTGRLDVIVTSAIQSIEKNF
jgi:ribonuclease-3 family protein